MGGFRRRGGFLLLFCRRRRIEGGASSVFLCGLFLVFLALVAFSFEVVFLTHLAFVLEYLTTQHTHPHPHPLHHLIIAFFVYILSSFASSSVASHCFLRILHLHCCFVVLILSSFYLYLGRPVSFFSSLIHSNAR